MTGSGPVRRALGPMVGGAFAGLGWWLLRSRTDVPPLSATIADNERIRLLPFGVDAALQVLVVGSGASLGREVAPRQFALALGNFATRWSKRLTAQDREILLASAALITSSLAVAVASFATHDQPNLDWPDLQVSARLIGLCSRWWPELPGNGKSILSATVAGGMTLETAAAI